jgi:hypothetical protein
MSWGVSIDQELGDHLGGYLRFAWQRDDAEVLYTALYSGGIEIKGQLWKRERDRIGIGVAYLEGGRSVAEHTLAFECYYRAMLTDHFGVTGDVQYMNDENRQGSSPTGWVLGVRTTARF